MAEPSKAEFHKTLGRVIDEKTWPIKDEEEAADGMEWAPCKHPFNEQMWIDLAWHFYVAGYRVRQRK